VSLESQNFDEIRPFNDAEIPDAIEQLVSDQEFISAIVNYRFGSKAPWLTTLLSPLVKWYLRRHWRSLTTVQDVQLYLAKYLNQALKKTSDGLSWSGLEKLDRNCAYLFISNHRDIAMDPAIVNWCLSREGFDTTRIAIGDNLLKKPCVATLMKMNKSFVVRRSAKGPREMLKALGQLSAYIGESLRTGHHIWIAQKEGRAKDGFDLTDPAILKMFYIDGKRQGLSFQEYMGNLRIVPVVISYEFDPCDASKANELVQVATEGHYQKSEFEDIESIVKGITGYKGRVHVHFGKCLQSGYETPEQLAALVDAEIYRGYHLYPANLIAAGQSDVDAKSLELFNQRIAAMPESIREQVLKMYANPYLNAQKQKAE
jgi:hypothetical protein